jgi:hypothetical protein
LLRQKFRAVKKFFKGFYPQNAGPLKSAIIISPEKPRSIKLCIRAAPTLPFLSLATTTAIDFG